MKATVIIQVFDNSAQEPGPDEVRVFATNKSKEEIVDENGFLQSECYPLIKSFDGFFYEQLVENDYEVTYIPNTQILMLDF